MESGDGVDRGWMDGVKVALGSRDVCGRCAKDMKEWRSLVHVFMIEFHLSIFAWFTCSFGLPFRSPVAVAFR